MARRSAVEVLGEAYLRADQHLAASSAIGVPALARDALALLFVHVIEAEDRVNRRVRKVRKRARRVRRMVAAVEERQQSAEAAQPAPDTAEEPGGEQRFAMLADDEWVKARLATLPVRGPGAALWPASMCRTHWLWPARWRIPGSGSLVSPRVPERTR